MQDVLGQTIRHRVEGRRQTDVSVYHEVGLWQERQGLGEKIFPGSQGKQGTFVKDAPVLHEHLEPFCGYVFEISL